MNYRLEINKDYCEKEIGNINVSADVLKVIQDGDEKKAFNAALNKTIAKILRERALIPSFGSFDYEWSNILSCTRNSYTLSHKGDGYYIKWNINEQKNWNISIYEKKIEDKFIIVDSQHLDKSQGMKPKKKSRKAESCIDNVN